MNQRGQYQQGQQERNPDETGNRFELTGIVKAVEPVETVTGKNGKTYEKRKVIIDTTTNTDYPTLVEIEYFGQTIHTNAKEMMPGDKVSTSGTVTTRFNAAGKGYTTCKAFFVRFISRSPRKPVGAPDATNRQAGKYDGVDETENIPF